MTISDCLSLYRSNIQAYAYNQTQIPIVNTPNFRKR